MDNQITFINKVWITYNHVIFICGNLFIIFLLLAQFGIGVRIALPSLEQTATAQTQEAGYADPYEGLSPNQKRLAENYQLPERKRK